MSLNTPNHDGSAKCASQSLLRPLIALSCGLLLACVAAAAEKPESRAATGSLLIVGGGDTVGYVEERKLTGCFGHVSTGGGASLELMSGRKLPGVEALLSQK